MYLYERKNLKSTIPLYLFGLKHVRIYTGNDVFVLPEADGNRPFRSAPLGHAPLEVLLQKGEGEAEPHGPRPAA